jgi:hypothetical protein
MVFTTEHRELIHADNSKRTLLPGAAFTPPAQAACIIDIDGVRLHFSWHHNEIISAVLFSASIL